MTRVGVFQGVDKYATSTGLIRGCVLSPNGGDNTKYDMTEGRIGHINRDNPDSPIWRVIPVPAVVAGTVTNLASQTSTLIFIDPDNPDVPSQQFLALTATERRDFVEIGGLVHPDLATVTDAVSTVTLIIDVVSQIHDHFEIFPFSVISGNEIFGKSGVVQLLKLIGTGQARGRNFENPINGTKNPHNVSLPALDPIVLIQIFRDGSLIAVPSATIDPSVWDDGTQPLVAVTGPNQATIMRLYSFPDNSFILLHGQEQFSTFSGALAEAGTEDFVVPAILGTAALVARIVVDKAVTDASVTGQFTIIP